MRSFTPVLCLCLALAACDVGTEIPVPADVTYVTVGELVANRDTYNGQVVAIRDAVVLAHDSYDEVNTGGVGTVYFGDSGNDLGHSIQAFAPQVRIRSGDYLQPGDVVDVVGQFVNFAGPPPCNPPAVTTSCFRNGRSVPQTTFGTVVSRTGYWNAPVPIPLTAAEYMADPARYQGALVTIRDLSIMTPYALVFSMSGRPRIDAAVTNEGVRLGADLYRIPGVTAGTRITRLTGVASYFFDDFIMPRSADDVEVDSTSPVAEDGTAACSDGLDNDSDGAADCEDNGCCTESRCHTLVLSEVMPNPTGADSGAEWIELHNSADFPVALGCMSLGRGNGTWSGLAPIGGRVAAGGCVVVGGGAPTVDIMATFSPELADGGSPGVGVGLFDGTVGNINPSSVPADALIYGDDNASMLSDRGGVPTESYVGTPPEGSSLERTSLSPRVWQISATPTPGACSAL